MSHQPNPDNSHDHTYPTKPEGLSIAPFPERATYRMDAMERRIAALEKLIIASAPTQPAERSLAAETIADAAAAAILAYINRNESHTAVQALDVLRNATPTAVWVTLRDDAGSMFTLDEIMSGLFLLRQRLNKRIETRE